MTVSQAIVPETLTRRQVRDHYGLGPTEVEAVFRAVPVVSLPGCRTVRVRRADLDQYLTDHMTRPGEVRA